MNKITEVIWADNTIPPKEVAEKFKFTDKEFLTFAINFLTTTYFSKKGFKILEQLNDPTKLPNIIVEKDDKKYGISVVPYIDGQYRFLRQDARIGVTKILKENNITSVYCPVGFRSSDKARSEAKLLLKGDNYNITLRGFVFLNDEEYQDLESNTNFIKEL